MCLHAAVTDQTTWLLERVDIVNWITREGCLYHSVFAGVLAEEEGSDGKQTTVSGMTLLVFDPEGEQICLRYSPSRPPLLYSCRRQRCIDNKHTRQSGS